MSELVHKSFSDKVKVAEERAEKDLNYARVKEALDTIIARMAKKDDITSKKFLGRLVGGASKLIEKNKEPLKKGIKALATVGVAAPFVSALVDTAAGQSPNSSLAYVGVASVMAVGGYALSQYLSNNPKDIKEPDEYRKIQELMKHFNIKVDPKDGISLNDAKVILENANSEVIDLVDTVTRTQDIKNRALMEANGDLKNKNDDMRVAERPKPSPYNM